MGRSSERHTVAGIHRRVHVRLDLARRLGGGPGVSSGDILSRSASPRS